MTNPALSLRGKPSDPTAQQVAASDPASSVWVNASAGSGKTKILTDRVTRLLLSGVRPDKILCLTFTRAAAAEMALRVAKMLGQWAVCSDNELSASLGDLEGKAPSPAQRTRSRRLFAEILACPGGMRIRTLHAFGQEILHRFPVESGLPPHFRVIEDEDARALQEEVLGELLRETAAQPETETARAVTALIDALGETRFRELARNLLRETARISEAAAKHGGLGALIGHMRAELGLLPGDDDNSLIHAAFEEGGFPEDDIREAAKLLVQGKLTYARRGAAILAWLEQDQNRRVNSYDAYAGCFLKQDGDLFKQYGDTPLLKKHPDLDRVLRREATRLAGLAERREAANAAAVTAAALIFGQAFVERYRSRKRRQAALDYDDLVNETLDLLRRPGIAPWILHKLDDGIDHVLVDEAQDTSRAQWDIVRVLTGDFFAGEGAHDNGRTLFVVGDEKQSIYSFQNADPEAFTAMRAFFKAKTAAAGKRWEEIPLHVSFRSAPAVLRAVDAVFARPEAADGVSATPVGHSAFRRGARFGRVELWPLLPQPKTGKDESGAWDLPIGYENERDPEAELAERIASTIKGWLRRGEKLPGTDRPIRPGDIMILLRRRGRFADLMVRALKKETNAVPVTGVDRMRLMEQLPVMDLLALVQFALLPEDNLNLAAVLRGPLLNLGEDDLMALAAGRGDASLWQRLKSSPSFGAARDYLAGWLGRADTMTPLVLLTHVLNEPCPASAVSGRRALWTRLGSDALDPIEELLNEAQNFSRSHAPSLQAFLHWLGVGDSEIKRELDRGDTDGDGQVQIMTVHASKGLEAPIVFLPDTAHMPRAQAVPNFLWDDARSLPFYLAGKPGAGVLRRLWDRARAKQLQEYRRLLYVAMTRASHRLIVGGWEPGRKEADPEGAWHSLVAHGMKRSEAHANDPDEKIPDENIIVWEDPAPPAETAATAAPAEAIAPLPAWIFRPAPDEPKEAEILAPSKLGAAPSAATPDRAFARGRIIHRLLQSLPDVEESRREEAAGRFLAQPRHGLTEAQQDEALNEVMALLRRADFAPLFGPQSRAEVPLAGSAGGRRISGQVDRLAMVKDEVWIVDYKTNRPPPADAAAIPEVYRAQMEAYRAVLQTLYPDRAVRCFLLWTYGPQLMEVPAPRGQN